MSCETVTPNQQQIVLVDWANETQLFLLYFSASSFLYDYWYAEIMIVFLNTHVMWPSDFWNRLSFHKKIYNHKENKGKKVL